ncbi:MAG: hypothetical protein WBO46_21730 [Caldilineaceae bacterium]
MTTIEIASPLAPVLEQFSGRTFSEKIAGVLSREIQRYLMECDAGMLELEIRYGMDYPEFQRSLEVGELGDEFQFQLEIDATRWSDLLTEKRHWLSQLRSVSELQD